jgi:hypothetical protein
LDHVDKNWLVYLTIIALSPDFLEYQISNLVLIGSMELQQE